ncbi:MAG TPA: glycoside hydrolase 43 family protein [Firmicutes bacterium]|nr:glycoside hydrolase 43 family protein [Bacillota bacterium]
MDIPNIDRQSVTNPILPGFYPDPSICRVGIDYYLVTSSFAYFPGIPIFNSRDLVHWEQIGHVLDRPSQLDLDGVGFSEGIFAPTIRYHQGIFYVITTNISKGGNFIVTATDPAGPWSEPHWLKEAPGIDPSLFFDDDRVYYVGTRPVLEGEKYFGNWEIWLQEINSKTLTLKGKSFPPLWRGALKDAIWPEGPHIYKIKGIYYLMIAEGGTDYYHAVTIARSSNILGPYEGNPANPILTHRNLGRSYPIVNTGHGDMIETQNREWWMVVLASRPYGGYYRNLGRETFLVPVLWEDGWPIVSPRSGRVEYRFKGPNLPPAPIAKLNRRDHFEGNELAYVWNFIRTPRERFWSLTDRNSYLRLMLRAEKITDVGNPSFIGRRQQHINFTADTVLEFQPKNQAEAAGMVLLQNNRYHFRFEYTMQNQQTLCRLVQCVNGVNQEIATKPFFADRIYLKVVALRQNYSFYIGSNEKTAEIVAENVDGRILSTDIAGGFVGAYIGIFASSNGEPSNNYADFDWFEYQEGSQFYAKLD